MLNSLSSIGVAAADPSDAAREKAEQREATESAIAHDSTRLETLEREVIPCLCSNLQGEVPY